MSDVIASSGDVPANQVVETYQPRLFSFSGRIGRLRYWIYGVMLSLAVIPLVFFALLGSLLTLSPPGPLSLFVLAIGEIAALVGGIVLIRRRLNDLDKSGWLSLLVLVPLVNALFGLWVLFCPGKASANRFGPPPSANSPAIIGAAWVMGVLTIGSIVAIMLMPTILGAGFLAAAVAGGRF